MPKCNIVCRFLFRGKMCCATLAALIKLTFVSTKSVLQCECKQWFSIHCFDWILISVHGITFIWLMSFFMKCEILNCVSVFLACFLLTLNFQQERNAFSSLRIFCFIDCSGFFSPDFFAIRVSPKIKMRKNKHQSSLLLRFCV